MGDEADGCCTVKRGFGIFILVLSIFSFVGTLICALIASATYMPLYAAFGWISFLLLIYIISTASAYVCCQACGSKVTGGLVAGYCVLAFVTFIVLATGQRSDMEHICEDTVECASISDWGVLDPECGRKTSSFSLCYLPETDERRRRLQTALDYHHNAGWCSGPGTPNDCAVADVACPLGETEAVAADCWAVCAAKYPTELVSVDIDQYDFTAAGMCDCCCQTECSCLEGVGWESLAVRAGYALPGSCDGGASGGGSSGGDVDPKWYYSKWGDDCQHGGGKDDHCRAFRTQDDCINYCNPHDDDADEQCEDVDDPEDCYSVVSHVNAVAGWSSFFAGLVFFPTLVWVALLFAVPDPQAAAPVVAAVELPRMQPQVMMVSPVSPGGGQPQVIMGQPQMPQVVQGGQPPVIMGQPQVVQGGQPPVIVQGEPSKLAEF